MVDPGAFKPDFAVALAPAQGAGASIEVRGELDSGTCEELLALVRSAVAGGPSELTLDLRQMTFIDSGGTRALIVIERLAADRRIPLKVTPPPEHVTELLRTAGVVDRIGPETRASSPTAGKFVERTELELPRDPHAPARARVEVRECVPGQGQPEELANLVLLTSELVTNAVVHPRGVGDTPISLRVIVYGDRVRVEVEDSGEGFEYVKPVLPEGERGRGLFLVDRFADKWGSGCIETNIGPRFMVWFELAWRGLEAEAVA